MFCSQVRVRKYNICKKISAYNSNFWSIVFIVCTRKVCRVTPPMQQPNRTNKETQHLESSLYETNKSRTCELISYARRYFARHVLEKSDL
mmetsp:Transcript_10344/g.13434  ORF Transcript_10344/g.13434 Transcript_10344/m.13434 type:complete len:90 (+) Transcript_10344:481-750(+)